MINSLALLKSGILYNKSKSVFLTFFKISSIGEIGSTTFSILIMFLRINDFSPSSEKITPGESNRVTFESIWISWTFFVKPGMLETPTALDFFKLIWKLINKKERNYKINS